MAFELGHTKVEGEREVEVWLSQANCALAWKSLLPAVCAWLDDGNLAWVSRSDLIQGIKCKIFFWRQFQETLMRKDKKR